MIYPENKILFKFNLSRGKVDFSKGFSWTIPIVN